MFITVEGVIGVGKSTATRVLADLFRCEPLFEIVEENPFLKDFYTDRTGWSLQTETFFLLNRLKQLEDTGERLKGGATVVADYHIVKNRIFAGLNLPASRQEKYRRVYEILTEDLPPADLVIYLRADHETVMERIRRRDRPFERDMDPDYIRRLDAAYAEIFAEPVRFFGQAPVLTVDTTCLDLVRNPAHRHQLAEQVSRITGVPWHCTA